MIYTYVAVALAAAITSAAAAWQVQNWRFDSERLEAAEQVRETEKMRRQAANKGATAHEADKTRIRTEFVEVTKEVERVIEKPIYRNVCLDDDGLRILNQQIGRANGDTGKPGDSVPKPAAPK